MSIRGQLIILIGSYDVYQQSCFSELADVYPRTVVSVS